MKRSSIAILFGVVFLLVGIEVLLLYIACTIQTEEDVTFEISKKNEGKSSTDPTDNCNLAFNLKLTTPFGGTTRTDRSITVSSTQLPTTSTQSTTDPWNLPSVSTVSSFSPPIVPNPTMATFECELNATEKPPMCTARPTAPTLPSHSSIAQLTTLKTNATSTNAIVKTTEARNKESTEDFVNPKFKYVLINNEGVPCVMANMTIQIKLQGTATNPQKIEELTVPADITPNGICAEKTINMTLSWEESTGSNRQKNKITFNYAHDNSKFFLDTIFVQLNEEKMRENTTSRSLSERFFSAKIENGIFMCELNTVINVEDRINVIISDIYLIVFNECFGNCTKTGTNCIIETAIRTIAIIGTIIIAIVLVLIFFVIYLLWYMERKLVLNYSKEYEPGTTL